MVSSTRSGQLHIDDDNEGSRSSSAVRGDRRVSNGQADSGRLRVVSRTTTPSPNSGRSERLEIQTTPTSRRSERLEIQATEGQGSHVRRSPRIEMSNPMRSDQKSRPLDKKGKNLVKSKMLSEVSGSTKFDLSGHTPTKKRKRLDARTYKAAFSAASSPVGLENNEESNAEDILHAKHCKKKFKKGIKGSSSSSTKQEEPDEEIDKDTCSAQRLGMEEVKNMCSEESVSEDGFPTSHNCPEGRAIGLSPTSVKRACNLDSEASLSSTNEHAPIQGASSAVNFSSSSPLSKIECTGNQRLQHCMTSDENVKASYPNVNNVEIQKDSSTRECVVCKNPETELCCNGKSCKMHYHLTCLDPPMKTVPPGLWFCVLCTKKKIEFGVWAVSEGIDSILDFKEGAQNDTSYLVKYKGLAHVHNLWVSESQLIHEAPELLPKLKDHQKSNAIRWKREWIEPQKLLQKRLLMPQEVADELFKRLGGRTSFYYEWFVKWKGLGYEDATWELEDSQFLRTPKSVELIKDYEVRHKKSIASNSSTAKKDVELKKNPFSRLLTLPDEFPADIDNDHLHSINKLREFWHKSQNAILIDDQERIAKALLFVLSLQSHVNQPFLIISVNNSLSLWETEIGRLAPSINIVVYSGNRDVRRMIQALEFYDESGCIMFQLLLSHPDAILEDFEVMKSIGWEALIFDDCQNPDVSKILARFNNLSTDFRLLLMNDQFKDDIDGYTNLVSFLCSGKGENFASTLKSDSDSSTSKLALLKERLAHFIAYECKPDSSKFLEYWVPVHLCNVQLERYCATLCSNSSILRSCSKVDRVGALRDTLVSSRKCCDHPYLVDEILQGSLVKDRPLSDHLDVGVNASGKLLVLDKILQALQKHGLRVLILFQSVSGDGRNSIGDILDDYLRQRFGVDCYERVDSGITMSRRLSALNNFNDKARGRFVFLIESRACLPSIRLSSVDAVIIYSSDWNPLNDLRAIQKIKMESPHTHISLFRLYSTFTVEEKVLVFAKLDLALESNAQNINPSVTHSLLSWGTTYLFHQLDKFHSLDNSNNCSQTITDIYHLDNVVMDVLSKLPCSAMSYESNTCTHLIEALRSGASYSRKIKLVGDKEGMSSLDSDPSRFWSNLLEQKDYHWRYISSEKSQRSRRKIHSSDEPTNLPEPKHNEVRGKCRKMAICSLDPISSLNCVQDKRKKATSGNIADLSYSGPLTPVSSKNASTNLAIESDLSTSRQDLVLVSNLKSDIINDQTPVSIEKQKAHVLDSADKAKLRAVQRNLHHLLKPQLSNLCDMLELPEDAKNLALALLEYIMTNHHVSKDSETMLQAIMMSLCWQASSLSKNKVNRDESLARAKKFLNFSCSKEKVYTVYDKLKTLKREFLSVMASRSEDKHNEVKEGRLRTATGGRCLPQMLPDKELLVKDGTSVKLNQKTDDKLLEKRISLINIMAARRAAEFDLKLQNEILDFQTWKGNEKLNLNRAHMKDLELICTSVIGLMERDDKIKLLKQSFSEKMTRFEKHMDCQLHKLKAHQLVAQIKEQQIKDRWLEEANTGILSESFHKIPLSDSGFIMEEFRNNIQQGNSGHDSPGKTISYSATTSPSGSHRLEAGELNAKNTDNSLLDFHTETECIHNEHGSLFSPQNSMDRTEGSVPRGDVVKVLSAISSQQELMPVRAESMNHQSNVLNIVTNATDSIFKENTADSVLNNLEPPLAFEKEQDNCRNNSDISCSESSSHQNIETGKGAENGHIMHSASAPLCNEAESTFVDTSNITRREHVTSENEETHIVMREDEVAVTLGNAFNVSHKGVHASCPGDIGSSQIEVANNILISDSLQHSSPVLHGVPCHGDVCLSQVEVTTDNNVLISGSLQHPSLVPHEVPSCRHNEGSECTYAQCQRGPSITEHQRLEDTVGRGDLDRISHLAPQPGSANASPQVEATIDNVTVSCSPVHVEGSEHSCSGSQHEHCNLEHNRLEETVGPGDLDCNIPMHNSAPISSQVEATNSNVVAHTEMPLVGTGQGNEGLRDEIECESFHQMNHSTRQVEVLLDMPAVESSMVIERSNLLVPHSIGQAILSNSDTVPQRTFDEEPTRTLFHAESSGQYQLFPFAPLLPHQGFQHEPLKNEMIRIRTHGDKISKMHDDMKLQLEQECEQEIEKIRKKYNELQQALDAEYVQKKTILETIFNKVHMNQLLAEEFRAKFICTKPGASAYSQSHLSSSSQQSLQASQVQLDHRHVLPSPSTPAFVTTPPAAVVRLRSSSPAVVPVYPGHTAQQRALVNPRNSFGPHFNTTISSPSNFQRASEFRAPPPHLQRSRPNITTSLSNLSIHTIGATSQQQFLGGINSGLRGQVASADTYSCTMAAVGVPPVVSGTIPVCQLNAEQAQDVGADLPSQSQVSDLGTTFGTTSPTGGFPQSSGLTTAAADVVYLSDDE